jgi:SAM-dependent methyltransferase
MSDRTPPPELYAYGSPFFDHVTHTALRAARIVVPLLQTHLRVTSILDVGCGQGAWLKVWAEHGAGDVLGLDGSYVDRAALLIPPDRFRPADLAAPIDVARRFDLVQCLEVAEHLPRGASETLVRTLVAHGPLLLFSAAPPGQGGEHHINERPHEFWRGLFGRHGYVLADFVRPRLARRTEVERWYRYNTFLFVERTHLGTLPEVVRASVLADEAPIPSVEPLGYRVRRSVLRRLPFWSVSALARLKHALVGWAPGRSVE